MATSSETIITWSLANWITIVLMVAIGFLVLGVIAGTARKLTGAGSDTSDAPNG